MQRVRWPRRSDEIAIENLDAGHRFGGFVSTGAALR
jgi:hypothetical protein